VARVGVTIAEKALAAMGYLQGASPRRGGGGDSRARATWGRTAPAIIDTCERFMADPMRLPEHSTTHQLTDIFVPSWLSGVHDRQKGRRHGPTFGGDLDHATTGVAPFSVAFEPFVTSKPCEARESRRV
jgi:hypothetical protein